MAIVKKDDAYTLSAEPPGIAADDIAVKLCDGVLTIAVKAG